MYERHTNENYVVKNREEIQNRNRTGTEPLEPEYVKLIRVPGLK